MKIQTNAPMPGRHVLIAFGVIAVLLSALLFWLGFRAMITEKRFANEGITTLGVIASKRIAQKTERNRDTNRHDIVTNRHITYEFTSDQGQNLVNEESVSQETWERIHQQDKVKVQYLRLDPSESRLADVAHGTTGYVYIGLGISGALLALLCLRAGKQA